LAVGSKKEITVSPSEGYGEINPQLKLKTGISIYPQDVKVKVGLEFSADIGEGRTQNFNVTHIEGEDVFIDGNQSVCGSDS
tara:strand:+ start:495 stop:737 length:243 start_codon:yes stop_codon:yes gene_type:complete